MSIVLAKSARRCCETVKAIYLFQCHTLELNRARHGPLFAGILSVVD